MVKLTIRNNVDQQVITVSSSKTVDEIIAECSLDMTAGRPMLNGVIIHGQTHLTLAELGAGDTARLTIAANKDNNA